MLLPANLIIVGLHSERPRSGKSTVAAALARLASGRVRSIAGAIRVEARRLGFDEAANAKGDDKDVPMQALGGLSPRQVLILIGEHRAKRYGQTYWLEQLIASVIEDAQIEPMFDHLIIIDDVRRAEEGQRLIDLGATVCTIERDGVADVTDINGWHSDVFHTFRNDGTPNDCAQRIWGRSLMNRARVRA
ncbi:hypothetical protein [Sphingomonas yantingensis]|uniref:Uncharacterized protein n=1 Tax=Sphingomonas yantingensis TaxID=1241761 RepID=A0A7W9ATA7_9SPHN|nr:hypothetical protein [Sphingomonas yantingensis]MBB5700026.1 hypothetical protein [Sphingomonas yantingensis]